MPDTRGQLRPEAELLVCCARLSLSAGERNRIGALLATAIDWEFLLKLASRHGLMPLLHRHLDEAAAGAIPRRILVELWGHHERTSRHNRAMATQLSEILQILEANGIPAVAYKGPALATAVYGDLTLREFRDLDLLLRPADVRAAQEVLKVVGYAPEYDLAPAVEAAFLRSSFQYHLVMAGGTPAVKVELHWRTDRDFPVEPVGDDGWWARLGWATFGGDKIRCFAAEELLLVLCLHGTKHAWGVLAWLVDVAELLRQHPDLDWEWITQKAEGLACTRRLALGLYLARHLLDAPLPSGIRDRVDHEATVRTLAATILGSLFGAELDEVGPLANLRFNLASYERPWHKLRHGINVLLAPSLIEWSRWPLPRALFFLYVPLRLMRLAGKYVRAWRLARSG